MSCNGCRVLRKGCSETCALRPCLQWIQSPEAQGHATVFVAKFFGRAGLMEFISAVPDTERAALFQSLLYEACGRTVNPVYGAIGLLWSGNWHVCQEAVDTVLKGGVLRPVSTAMPMGSTSMPTFPTKLQLITTSQREKTQTPVFPHSLGFANLSKSAPSFHNSIQAVRQKRSLGEYYKREVQKEVSYTAASECKRQRDYDDVPRRSCALARQCNTTTRCLTFSGISNPVLFHPRNNVSCAAAAKASSLRRRLEDHSSEFSVDCWTQTDRREDLSTEIHENPELDLTLSSIRLSFVSAAANKSECTRVSSPSSLSFNSEGSVTNFESPTFPTDSEHKLLDLLL